MRILVHYHAYGDAGKVPGLVAQHSGRIREQITRREEEVLLLRLKALKYRRIAAQLGISPNSVKTLLARALRKMQRASSMDPPANLVPTRDDDDEKGIAETLQ